MFQRFIDDFKDSTGTAVRLTSLAAAAGFALLVTVSFLCAAAFVYVLQHHGLVEACLTGAGVFFAVTLVAAACYLVRKSRTKVRVRVRETAKSPLQSAIADPMLVAAGVQAIRAIGIKRLIPILALGGLALGYLASRNNSDTPDDEPPEADA